LVLIFSQVRKFCNIKATGSSIISVVKQLSEKAITVVIRQLLLGPEVDGIS